jgi:hypothetical protein
MPDYTFFLNSTQIEEPIGFDALQLTLRRSDMYSGLEFSFSDSMKFTGSGAQILRDAYESQGFDAVVTIHIKDCDEGTIYEGVINFSLYKETNACDDCVESVTVGIQQSGLTQRFKNRMEIPVNLFKPTGLEGNSLSNIQPFDLFLHSKEILFQAEYKINPLLKDYTRFEEDLASVPPFDIVAADIEEALAPSSPDPNNPLFYSGFTYPAGVSVRTLRIRGRIKFTQSSIPGVIPFPVPDVFILFAVRGVQNGVEYTRTDSPIFPSPGVGTINVDYSFDKVFAFPSDSNFYIQIIGSRGVFAFDDQLSFITMEEKSILPASTAKALLVGEAFTRICESIAGKPDCFRSDYFGGTTSAPHAYNQDGCGRYISLTNGLNIRQLKDKEGNLYPITSSFKALFDALNAISPLGMRVEKEANGTEYIRVEPASYFYQDEVSYTFKHIKEIERSIAGDLFYNEVEIGYQKWETETKSGLDEFNSYHSYALPVIQAKRKLSAISAFVTSGYAIESTRRLQFKTDPSKDSSYDNENFLIASLRDGAGIKAERNENFSTVTGIQSPTTAYNLRFSPARMLMNWYPILAASLVKKTNPVITFQSGKGNYSLLTDRSDVCDQATALVLESQNITRANVKASLRNPYYVPELYSFEFPVSLKTFLNLRTKAIFAIRVGCTETTKCYLKEVTYQPNDGLAKFKVYGLSQNKEADPFQ